MIWECERERSNKFVKVRKEVNIEKALWNNFFFKMPREKKRENLHNEVMMSRREKEVVRDKNKNKKKKMTNRSLIGRRK